MATSGQRIVDAVRELAATLHAEDISGLELSLPLVGWGEVKSVLARDLGDATGRETERDYPGKFEIHGVAVVVRY